MRVLFESYSAIGRMYGGGPTVILNLAKALRSLGLDVKLHDPWNDHPQEFDIVHYFSTYENNRWLQRDWTTPFVVTPISWFEYKPRQRFEQWLKYGLRALRHRTRDRLALGYPFAAPDAFFPNSSGEGLHLSRSYGVPMSKTFNVPHGVSASFAEGSEDEFFKRFGLKDFILCVGRFEVTRKNQLRLVRAWRDEREKLVFIGGPEAGHESYFEECKRSAGPNTLFIEPLPHDSSLLRSAYFAARVVVMPALLESPGLVGLEGALGGAIVAATSRGSTQEYFGADGFYFNPLDESDIRSTVRRAYDTGVREALRDRVLARYTWDQIAKTQLAGYEWVLKTWRGRKSCKSAGESTSPLKAASNLSQSAVAESQTTRFGVPRGRTIEA